MAGQYDIFGLELNSKTRKEIISQTIWLKLGRWNYGDQPLRYRNVEQNRTQRQWPSETFDIDNFILLSILVEGIENSEFSSREPGKTAHRTLSTSSQTTIVACVHNNQC